MLAVFFAFWIYVVEIIILSIIFYFLPKYKNPYLYAFWSGIILELPFIIAILSDAPKSDIPEILLFMHYYNWAGWLYGFLYYYLYVRRRLKRS